MPVPPAPGGGGGHGGSGGGRRPNKGVPDPNRAFAFVMIPFLLLAGGGLYLLGQNGFTNPLQQEVSQALSLDRSAEASGSSGNGGGILAMIGGSGGPMPIDYLPPAPEGWIRVTAADAAQPDVMALIDARWARASEEDPGFTLPQNLGYKRLELFLELRARPDTEQRVLAKRRATALYLGTQGEFLEVQMEFLDNVRAIGTPDDPAGWTDGLEAQVAKKLEKDQIIERLSLAGRPVVNRTDAPGTSLINRPIGDQLDTPNGMRLAVPLSHRAVLHLHGLTTPRAAETVIASVDADAVAEVHR